MSVCMEQVAFLRLISGWKQFSVVSFNVCVHGAGGVSEAEDTLPDCYKHFFVLIDDKVFIVFDVGFFDELFNDTTSGDVISCKELFHSQSLIFNGFDDSYC